MADRMLTFYAPRLSDDDLANVRLALRIHGRRCPILTDAIRLVLRRERQRRRLLARGEIREVAVVLLDTGDLEGSETQDGIALLRTLGRIFRDSRAVRSMLAAFLEQFTAEANKRL